MNRRELAWLVLLGALWGAVYPLNTVVLQELSPSEVVVGRTGLAAVALVPVAWQRGVLDAMRARPIAVLGAGLLQATIPLVLLTAGQQHVDAGLAGIVLASQPVWAATVTGLLDRRAQLGVVVGIVIGLAGVVLLFVRDFDVRDTSRVSGAMLVGAAICYAAGAVYIERVIPKVPAVATATAAMLISAFALIPFAIEPAPSAPSLETVGWLVILSVAATAGALVLFYELIQRSGAVKANLAGYLAPAFAAAYGVALLDEQLSLTAAAGLGCILAGTYIAGPCRKPTYIAPN